MKLTLKKVGSAENFIAKLYFSNGHISHLENTTLPWLALYYSNIAGRVRSIKCYH